MYLLLGESFLLFLLLLMLLTLFQVLNIIVKHFSVKKQISQRKHFFWNATCVVVDHCVFSLSAPFVPFFSLFPCGRVLPFLASGLAERERERERERDRDRQTETERHTESVRLCHCVYV